MRSIIKPTASFIVAVLFAHFATAQITETEPAQTLDSKLTLHRLSVSNQTAKPVATLYFYRPYMSKLVASLKKMSLYVNDTLIYELKANNAVAYPVFHSGRFTISGDKKDKTSMTVTIKPGNDYFFSCWMPTSMFDPPMTVESVHPTLARKEIGLPQTGAVAVAVHDTIKTASQTVTTAIKDTAKTKQDSAFNATHIPARFPGGPAAWVQFLQENINTKLGRKYIDIPRNEPSAKQVAMISFLVDKTGAITEVKIDNPDAVHPKLAAEAIRVISKSPAWIPATINGKKVVYRQKQSISFEAVRG